MALNYNTFLQDLRRADNRNPVGGSLIRFQSATRVKGQVERISGLRFSEMSIPAFQKAHDILQQINIIKRISQGLIKGPSVNLQRSKDHLEQLKIELRALTGRVATQIDGDPQIDPLTQGIGFAPRGDRPQGGPVVIDDPRQTSDPDVVLVEVDL